MARPDFSFPIEQMKESPFEPINPEKFERELAARINQLMADPKNCRCASGKRADGERKRSSAGGRSRRRQNSFTKV